MANSMADMAAPLISTDRTAVLAPPLAPADQAIDVAHLQRMTCGERQLEAEVLQIFDYQAHVLLNRMAHEPPKVVAALAHTLTGSARGVGAWKVAAAAEMVERLAREPAAPLTDAENYLASAIDEAQAMIVDLLRAR